MRFFAPHPADIASGRADLAVARFDRDFASWRGKAIEPVVHEAISRLALLDERLTGVTTVGAWWDRAGRHHDVVGATRSGAVGVIGTIK